LRYGERLTRFLLAVAVLVGLVPFGLALCALIGLGLVRELHPVQVAATATLVTCLPVIGVWAAGGRRAEAAAVGLAGWSVALLVGLPGYFPGEVGGAISSGLAVLVAPAGEGASRAAARFGRTLAEPVAKAPAGTPPLPEAERPPPDCPPPPVAPSTPDQVALPYEGQGHSLSIPVAFGDTELQMLFDTGASVTTLNRATLRQLGVPVPADAPEITLRTANGERTARLVLIPKLWVGGLPVEGVTVGICEECADDHTSGLLGLNVSGQFLVTLDTARREVVFQVRPGDPERLTDVAPWLEVRATATLFPDDRVEVEVEGVNRAPRPIRSARVGIRCGDEVFQVKLSDVPARGVGTGRAALPRGVDCASYTVTLDSARW